MINKRKNSFKNNFSIAPLKIPRLDINNNNNTFNKTNKNYISFKNAISTPPGKIHEYSFKTTNIKCPKGPKFHEQSMPKYNTHTINQFHTSSNNQKSIKENNSKKILFPKIKAALKNHYSLSNMNISNNKRIENPFSLNDNSKIVHINKKNPTILNIEQRNNANKNKYLIEEKINTDKYDNHQTKSIKITKLKILPNNKSQEVLKNKITTKNNTPFEKNTNSTFKNKNLKNNEVQNKIKDNKNRPILNVSNEQKNKIINNNTQTQDKNNILKEKKEKIENKRKQNTINIDSFQYTTQMLLMQLRRNVESFEINNRLSEMWKEKTPTIISPSIFTSYQPKFKPSLHSLENEFNNNDLIKAYAYNSSDGIVRDYNEDTITVAKINLNLKEKNYFHFFALYDGHGGKGCSYFLKKYLHKYIKEFSFIGIKNAIYEAEKIFLENYAIVKGNLTDKSGSCGVMALFKNNKCIIANVGDSRCLLFKNNRLVFSTRDHKPNEPFEKRRIKLAGGSVYRNKGKRIYQNGKRIKLPHRVIPGYLSVSRTFGDITTKEPKFGGKKGVVVAEPDIVELDLNESYNFMVIGCDGIFDVMSNTEILDCIHIVLKLNKNNDKKINELCGDFADMIVKSALAKESFDNVSCIVIAFNINGLV